LDFCMRIFWKVIFWLVLETWEINSYRVIRYLEGFWSLFEDFLKIKYIFCMVKCLSFLNSSFCIKIHFNVNGKAILWHTPCFLCGFIFKNKVTQLLMCSKKVQINLQQAIKRDHHLKTITIIMLQEWHLSLASFTT